MLRLLERIEVAARSDAYPRPQELDALTERLAGLQHAITAHEGAPVAPGAPAALTAARQDVALARRLAGTILERLTGTGPGS